MKNRRLHMAGECIKRPMAIARQYFTRFSSKLANCKPVGK